MRVERSGGEELSSYARGAAGSLPRARRESASVRASRSVTSIARTRLRLRGPTSAGRRRLRARASNALRPAPGLTITHFSSRGRLNLTRVSRSTSWCIPRPRRRSLCVSVCFSRRADRSDGEDSKFAAGEAEGAVRDGKSRDLSLQRRLAEP